MSTSPDSKQELRESAVSATKRFKTHWLELGGILQQVRQQQAYKAWGYKTFEAYCSGELFIKPAIALKLTQGYAFLEQHEKELLEKTPDKAMPFEVVQVLVKASENGALTDADYTKIRTDVVNGRGTAEERAESLRQRLMPPGPKPTPKPKLRLVEAGLRRHAANAKMLHEELCLDRRVPTALREQARVLVEGLDALLRNHEGARA